MRKTEKCQLCSGSIELTYQPMTEWNVKGPLCGKCYSKKILEYYPGDHTRVDLSSEK